MVDVREGSAVGMPPMGGAAKNDDPEVVVVAKRRTFSETYKKQILEEVDCAGPGEIGLILRREGLYSSQLSQWRKRRIKMSGKKKSSSMQTENQRLQKKVAKLTLRLQKAEAMLELQKKTVHLISLMNKDNESGSIQTS